MVGSNFKRLPRSLGSLHILCRATACRVENNTGTSAQPDVLYISEKSRPVQMDCKHVALTTWSQWQVGHLAAYGVAVSMYCTCLVRRGQLCGCGRAMPSRARYDGTVAKTVAVLCLACWHFAGLGRAGPRQGRRQRRGDHGGGGCLPQASGLARRERFHKA